MRTWYHWIQNGVDFLTLDNASNDQFDSEQVAWVERVVARDIADPAILAIVAGMHAALPDSLASDHSMTDWAQGEKSGRRVYAALLKAQKAARRSTSGEPLPLLHERHLRLPYWREHGGVLPG